MNKGGPGGPTATADSAAFKKQHLLQQRLETDIGYIAEGFSISVNVARINELPYKNSQDASMLETRAARMVASADDLLKLISELKQTAIFSGFASLNDQVEKRNTGLNQQAEKTDRMLARIAEEAAASLKEMEAHYYSSAYRSN